ncbi:DUF1543 domain-containing protein [Acetobacter suratthaniensis]|uniref:DUF1543 domain-containing protein n=1 Tax=Acetobacter suratthaniensis TaxID=1502841 RepID=A0ABS3LN13_9PROT|nr:DUF1543 domain-containing protein [Acetobacter suratthaniensis]MBO1328753.1 DUF1543 domain-containing protein [Acetobacter suratthaniensis]MCX2566796.1 DUF1543 domain-containing protein [Acetobacter suratthaniensis]
MTLKLYVFYLGGSAPGANLELHDVQFALGTKPEDTYPTLARHWFGARETLHIDAYGLIEWADGHTVTLCREAPQTDQRLYFVNMGGYRPGILAEEHEFGFFVAASAAEAKNKARKHLLTQHENQHPDAVREVDQCLLLEELDGYYIHLTPNPEGVPPHALWQGAEWI